MCIITNFATGKCTSDLAQLTKRFIFLVKAMPKVARGNLCTED